MAAKGMKALQIWCKRTIEDSGYENVSIDNMTTSWRDGLAFCALIHRYRPDLIDFNSLSKENVLYNNQLAFSVAEKELGIAALLDPEDMVAMRVPDKLSIMTYVSQYYNRLHTMKPADDEKPLKRKSTPTSTPEMVKIQKKDPEPVVNKENKETNVPSVTANTNVVPKPIFVAKPSTFSTCEICKKKVHLVERFIDEGKVYHRQCHRTKSLSGMYRRDKSMISELKKYKNAEKGETTNSNQTNRNENRSTEAPVKRSASRVADMISVFSNGQKQKKLVNTENAKEKKKFEKPESPKPEVLESKSVNKDLKDSNPSKEYKPIKAPDTTDSVPSEREFPAGQGERVMDKPQNERPKPVARVENIVQNIVVADTKLENKTGKLPLKDNSGDNNTINETKVGEPVKNTKISQVKETVKHNTESHPKSSEPVKNTTTPQINETSKDKNVESQTKTGEHVKNATTPHKIIEPKAYAPDVNILPALLKSLSDVRERQEKTEEVSPNRDLSPSSAIAPLISELPASPVKRPTPRARNTSSETKPKPRQRSFNKHNPGPGTNHRDYAQVLNPFDESDEEEADHAVARANGTPEEPNDAEKMIGKTDLDYSAEKTPQQTKEEKISDKTKDQSEDKSKETSDNTAKQETKAEKTKDYSGYNPFEDTEDDLSDQEDVEDTKNTTTNKESTNPFENLEDENPFHEEEGRNPFEIDDDSSDEAYDESLNPFGDADWAQSDEIQENGVTNGDLGRTPQQQKNVAKMNSAPKPPNRRKGPAPPPPKAPSSEGNFPKSPSPKPPRAEVNMLNVPSPRGKPPRFPTPGTKVPTDSTPSTGTGPPVAPPRHSPATTKRRAPNWKSDMENKMEEINEANSVDKKYIASPEMKKSDAEATVTSETKHAHVKKKQPITKPARPAPGYGFPLIKRDVKREMNEDEIMSEMTILDVQLKDLEKKGVKLEEVLRDEMELEAGGEVKTETDQLLPEWFELVHEKNKLVRRETDLVYLMQQQRLEQEHADIEFKIRKLLNKPDAEKTSEDKDEESRLLDQLVEVVERRNVIINSIEEARLKEEKEDAAYDLMKHQMESPVHSDNTKKKKKKNKVKKMFSKKKKPPKHDSASTETTSSHGGP